MADATADLPLLSETPRSWAVLAASHLDVFLSDHAVCEQQAALTALGLVGRYPEDALLVERMTVLATEEIAHLRRVIRILHGRGLRPARRRPNPWVGALREHMETDREPELKIDRLLIGALVEARSCERFTRLLEVVEDGEVAALMRDLGPAEARHWRLFHDLAARHASAESLERRWHRWLEVERKVSAEGGTRPTVHG